MNRRGDTRKLVQERLGKELIEEAEIWERIEPIKVKLLHEMYSCLMKANYILNIFLINIPEEKLKLSLNLRLRLFQFLPNIDFSLFSLLYYYYLRQ